MNINILDMKKIQKQTERKVEQLEQLIGVEIPATEKCRLYSMIEVEEVKFFVKSDLIRPLRFFIINDRHLNYMQNGEFFESIRELDYHKSFWAFDRHTNREGMREIFYRKKTSSLFNIVGDFIL